MADQVRKPASPEREFWERRYTDAAYAYGTEPNGFLVEVADRIPPGPVLCLAEGEGRNAVWLAGRGHAVCAVDAGLREDLAGLDLEIGREVERDVVEGRYHTGRAAVVQVVARCAATERRPGQRATRE